ncbi:MAG: DUF3419 family protein [Chitinophagaceae bacterium]
MLYYSHVNEDSRAERELLKATSNNTIVAVAGSGERVIALLDEENCRHIHVVDVNEDSLFLLELKLTALKTLSIDEYFQFCGFSPSGKQRRTEWYKSFSDKISIPCRSYWNRNMAVIEAGIVYAGHFEKFLDRIRPLMNFFLGKGFKVAFKGNPVTSKEFPRTRWNLLCFLFSRRWVYKLWGNKDAAFISEDSAIREIPSALNEIIYHGEAGACFMTHLIFKRSLREMHEADLPPSLQKSILGRIKERLNGSAITIQYHHTDILDFSMKMESSIKKPAFYSISDILSFESNDYLRQLLHVSARTGNTIVWRTFLRNRNNGITNNSLINSHRIIKEHTDIESTRMYQVFSV